MVVSVTYDLASMCDFGVRLLMGVDDYRVHDVRAGVVDWVSEFGYE